MRALILEARFRLRINLGFQPQILPTLSTLSKWHSSTRSSTDCFIQI
jgi:hypothetical protein